MFRAPRFGELPAATWGDLNPLRAAASRRPAFEAALVLSRPRERQCGSLSRGQRRGHVAGSDFSPVPGRDRAGARRKARQQLGPDRRTPNRPPAPRPRYQAPTIGQVLEPMNRRPATSAPTRSQNQRQRNPSRPQKEAERFPRWLACESPGVVGRERARESGPSVSRAWRARSVVSCGRQSPRSTGRCVPAGGASQI